jgi:hypothetical protein
VYTLTLCCVTSYLVLRCITEGKDNQHKVSVYPYIVLYHYLPCALTSITAHGKVHLSADFYRNLRFLQKLMALSFMAKESTADASQIGQKLAYFK